MVRSAGSTHDIYAVVSKDRFLRTEALAGILASLDDDADMSQLSRVDGAQVDLADVLDDVRTPSLLGDRRIVVVDGADALITRFRKSLEKFCQNPSGSGILILLCDSLPKNTNVYKAIATKGEVVAVEPPKSRAVGAWVAQRAENAYGKRIGARCIQCLREQVGDAPAFLDAELSKLAEYVGQRPEITPDDVAALTGHLREEKVFAVVDAVASGATAEALKQWDQVLATDRAATDRAIGGLAWSVRRLLEARRDLDRGVPIASLARRMYMDPALLQRRLQRLSLAQLEAQQRDLLAADLAMKTGGSTLERSIEAFIIRHSAAATTQPSTR